MEGIRDGRAVDRCFYCALLYPEVELCPRCGNRLHYQPARMAALEALQARRTALVKQFQADSTKEHAQALLEFLFQNKEECDVNLGRAEDPALEDLRRSFEGSE